MCHVQQVWPVQDLDRGRHDQAILHWARVQWRMPAAASACIGMPAHSPPSLMTSQTQPDPDVCCGAGAQAALAKLYRTIEVQVAHQAALSSLAGRLDLLCAQIPAASGKKDVVYQPQVRHGCPAPHSAVCAACSASLSLSRRDVMAPAAQVVAR